MDTVSGRTVCPGCALFLAKSQSHPPDLFNASGECWKVFSNLSCYTVAKQDDGFIHQHAVDAYGAQHAGGTTRNITVAFGLIGLYLALERGFTGREVQLAHMKIAKLRKDWPRVEPAGTAAGITVMEVLQAGTDAEIDAMIRRWMAAVWENWTDRQAWVRTTTDGLLFLR